MAGFCMLGGFAEVAVAPEHFTFKLPDEFDFARAPRSSSTTTRPTSP